MFSAQFYPAQKFLDYNIINRILPAEDLENKAEKYMQNMADNGPTLAFAATKKIIQCFDDEGVAQADQMTCEPLCLIQKIFKTGFNRF